MAAAPLLRLARPLKAARLALPAARCTYATKPAEEPFTAVHFRMAPQQHPLKKPPPVPDLRGRWKSHWLVSLVSRLCVVFWNSLRPFVGHEIR